MPLEAILHEVERLHDVRKRLSTLAEQYPQASEAILTISGRVRNTAAVLGGLVATKMTGSI
jgi:hypothetical protein